MNIRFKKSTKKDFWAQLKAICCALDVPIDTFHQWKSRGYVPPSRHYEIVEAARMLGVKGIDHKKLHQQHMNRRNS